jgi:hypothetical protein
MPYRASGVTAPEAVVLFFAAGFAAEGHLRVPGGPKAGAG